MTAISMTPSLLDLLPCDLAALSAAPSPGADLALGDEQLMLRYQSGDASAFQQLYRRHCDRLYRFILRMAANPAETEEIFQEVWIAVIRTREGYTPSAKFVTWLFAIAHRRAMDRLRGQRRADEKLDLSRSVDDDEFIDMSQAEPGDVVWRAGAGQALLEAIAALPVLQREAFLLQAEGELSVEEIAKVTGTNRETAKSRLRYASRRLRAMLEAWR